MDYETRLRRGAHGHYSATQNGFNGKNSMLISRSYVIGCLINLWVIFGYVKEETLFLKGFVKSRKIRDIEDLMLK